MAVVSVRLNEQEEKILDYLVEELHEEKSTLFKKSLIEMYEDHQDIKFIDNYIQKSRKKKPTFISADELLKESGAKYIAQQLLCGSGGDKPRLHANWALSRFLHTQKYPVILARRQKVKGKAAAAHPDRCVRGPAPIVPVGKRI